MVPYIMARELLNNIQRQKYVRVPYGSGEALMGTYDDQRKEKRDTCNVNIVFGIDPEDCDTVDCGPWSNVTFNISYTGMCIYSDREISIGKKVNIFLKHVSNDPLIAVVRWCTKMANGLYQVGIQYV
jgi:hypothetical protein